MRTFSKKALSVFLSLVFVVGCIIPVAAAGKTFADVKSNQWFYSYVDYMAEKDVIAGHAETNLFKPNDNVKRNEFIKMVNCVFGLKEEADVSFSDVPATSWYAPYYRAAYKQGYLTKAFGSLTAQQPTKELTREEAVALLMAYMDPDIDVSNQTLSFKDASSINAKYKDFILQSVYQGIVIGYDDNTFKPTKTLTRAEAAKILCVAAGTIVTSGNVAKAETEVSGNVVVNGSESTVGFNVDGDLIITEAVGGKVYIKNSVVNGTVYIRAKGTSSVEFSNCKVASVIVESNASVMLSGGTTVTDFTVEGTSLVGLNGGLVKNFTVAATAKDCKLLSEGNANAVENYAIYATGFNSAVLHSGNITFGTGIKATIAGKEYSGSGFVADSLRTSWSGDEEYIHYTVVNDGYVDYFYSKTSTATTSTFANLYNATSGALKATKQVSVGQSVNEKTANASLDYKYLVIAFRTKDGKYDGVKSINRELELYGISGNVTAAYSAGGFKVSFSVGINDTAHKNWKAYYTFTDNKDFSAADIKNISLYKTLTSGTVFKEAAAEGKKYIAVFIYENGIVHEPKLAEIPVFYNGFTSMPTITINGGDKEDTLSYALPGSGKIKYFYAKTLDENYTKNETTFNNEYYAISGTALKGEITVYGSGSRTTSLKKASAVEGYNFVILCVEGHDPVYVTRMYSGTGFASKGTPVAYEIGNNRAIAFTPAVDCTLKYMYVSSVQSFTTRGFNELYGKTDKTLKGEITGCLKDKARFAELKTDAKATKYLAVMLTNDGVDYQPICITLVDPGTGVKAATFSADIIADSLKFTGTHNFGDEVTVSYEAFYVNSDSIAQTAYINQMKTATTNGLANNLFKLAEQVIGEGFGINADGTVNGGRLPTDKEKEIAIRLVINGKYVLTPFVLTISKFDYGFDSTTVSIKETDGRENITLTLEEAGTIKYYYTNTAPASSAVFDAAYTNATYNGSKTVTGAGQITVGNNHIYALAGYKYIAFMFTDKDGKQRTPQIFIRTGSNTTAVKSAKGRVLENSGIEIVYELTDIFDIANVTPYISYMTSKTRLTNIDLDDFTNFKALNGSTGTDGLINIGYNVAKDVNYVYIVVGVKRGSTVEYKFLPFEVVIPRTNIEA